MRGYHKPIMLAGGLGSIQAQQTHKDEIPEGALLIQLGGPGMLIGLGGGAASSMDTGTNANPIWISTRCSAATPKSSGARKK